MQRVIIYNDLLHLTVDWMNADMFNLSLSLFSKKNFYGGDWAKDDSSDSRNDYYDKCFARVGIH